MSSPYSKCLAVSSGETYAEQCTKIGLKALCRLTISEILNTEAVPYKIKNTQGRKENLVEEGESYISILE